MIGREPELARIDLLLARAREGRGGALVVRGEPGIGKTTLLAYSQEQAAEMRVLHARGVEAEAELAFSGLHELMRPLLGLLAEIPETQAAALRGALALGPPVDAHLQIAAGVLSLLALAAEQEPLLLLVDDAHWLDAETARALAFVARRLEHDPVLLLFGAREGDPRTFEPSGLDEVVLTGLAHEQSVVLLQGEGLPGRVVDELHRATGGNPLALLELPRTLDEAQRSGAEPLAEPLSVTVALQAAFARRIRVLSTETQRALLVAAAEQSSELRLIARACATLGVSLAALDDAGELVSVSEHGVLFRHPLVRAAVYHAARAAERRAVHRAFADASGADGDAARHAWHLAAAALEPDEEVAAALEAAGYDAILRSGYLTASVAFERAAALSPEPEARAPTLPRRADSYACRRGQSKAAVARARPRSHARRRPPLRHSVRPGHADVSLRSSRRGPAPARGRDRCRARSS